MAQIHKSAVSVGPVTTDAGAARQNMTVGTWRLSVFAGAEDDPRIRDLDLAERLGYARRHNIRDLIRRLIASGELRDVHVVRTVRKTQMPGKSGVREVEVDEFWLTEDQALFIVARSETEIAGQLLREVIEVFRLAIRGLLTPGRAHGAEARLAMFLLTERQQVERFLSTGLIREICKLYGYDHRDGDRPPQFFRMVAERIYAAVFGAEVHGAMQDRGDKKQYYQFLTDNAHALAQSDLGKLETLARSSFNADEFWLKVTAEYRGNPQVQGRLPGLLS